jgi:hypothetical protein
MPRKTVFTQRASRAAGNPSNAHQPTQEEKRKTFLSALLLRVPRNNAYV